MGVVFLLMFLFLPLLQDSKAVRSATAVTETEMAVKPPDIPQDWQSRWSTMPTRKRTLSYCTDRRYGFEAKFPLLLRPQLGEIANPRLW
jgi:hypothetical protein